nr:PREDICTED: LOW QUALITY PROTEIN: coiled-coil domain-containing protein 150-like [Haliaeetus albicilla]
MGRAQLEQCLNAIHEEHLQEMKIVQQEAMKLDQPRSDMKEAEEEAKEEVQRLSTALEITTASKMHVVTAAEELRNTEQKINCRLQEVQILQQDCQELCKDVQLAQVRLQEEEEEEERTAQLEQQCTQLKAELGVTVGYCHTFLALVSLLPQ